MALCPTAPNPPVEVTESLISPAGTGLQAGAWKTIKDIYGDYVVAGVGTRNFGTGNIKLTGIPQGAEVDEAYLIFNTYVSNNIAVPIATFITVPGGGPVPIVTTLYAICGSTCWFNPPAEPTTYLRNRIYVSGNISATVTGNGNYEISGLPFDVAMPIVVDGTRAPGCLSNQGAILLVIWKWPGIATKVREIRSINIYLGAVLIASNPIFGGVPSYNLPFRPVKVGNNTVYKGNANITAAAGDAQLVLGDTFAVNQFTTKPATNAWTRNLPALSVIKINMLTVYDGENSAFASTTNDCIDWFFFAVSGDSTSPIAQMQIVNCAATMLLGFGTNSGTNTPQHPNHVVIGLSPNECRGIRGIVIPSDTRIYVESNFVQSYQTFRDDDGPRCRAVPYTDNFEPPKTNAPGMFPAATPFYISIDKEIMRVVGKCGKGNQNRGPKNAQGVPYPDPPVWTVQRAQNGTTAAFHDPGACVYFLAPPKFIKDMASGLAAKGKPPQKPGPGVPGARRRKPR